MTYPTTPSAVAQAALDSIRARPAAFNMSLWFSPNGNPTGVGSLAPDEKPACGSTLCAAGWVVHVAGWTLVRLPRGESTYTNGRGELEWTRVLAEKNGVRRLVDEVANELLYIDAHEEPWHGSADEAIEFLERIATSGQVGE